MFTLIQPNDFSRSMPLLRAMFRLRKKVFHDQLDWNVCIKDEMEFDEYDNSKVQYLVWCSSDRKNLYGAVRLMATTEPTLLYDVFAETHGNSPDLIGDDVLEGTRMCIDEELVAADFPTLAPGAGFNLLFLALCEAGLALGARRLVSNFEPAMRRIYRRAGLDCEIHGKADGYGQRPVFCASFEVSTPVLAKMRRTIGVELPLLALFRTFEPLPTRAPDQPLALDMSARTPGTLVKGAA
jgi:N-acyl-L-homoserine lactone synthetase